MFLSIKSLTPFFSVAEVRRHSYHPLLPHAHAAQALVQPVNHLVRPQHGVLKALVVVPGNNVNFGKRFFFKIVIGGIKRRI